MTKTKKIIVGTIISVVTLGGLISYAAPAEHFGKFGGMNEKRAEFIINRVSSKLDLSDVQKQNLIALKDVLKEQREVYRQKHNPREEIMSLLSTPVLDETKALTLLEERTAQLHIAAPSVVSAIANFTNSLNTAQKEQLKGFMDKIAKHRRGFGQH